MNNQFSLSQQETSLLDEIFMETGAAGSTGICTCNECNAGNEGNSSNAILREVHALGWELSNEEEYELSKAFEKIKSFAKRSWNKAKPWVAAADIVRRLISPPVEPVPVMKDIAAYIEQDKKRQTDERVERANAGRNILPITRESEMSVLQEIFMEAEGNNNGLMNEIRLRDCEGKSQKDCYGACRASDGTIGTCQWGGTTYGCRCRSNRGSEPLPASRRR